MLQNYAMAKVIISLIAIVGILGMAAGVIMVFFGGGRGGLIMALLSAAPVIGGAAMIYLAAQIASAQIETAENTAELTRGMERLFNLTERLAKEAATRKLN